jgi:predicted phosphodiesterase
MALYGVLGDCHGNIEALRAALAALDARGVRELLCVGDVVGYNADSDACAALLRSRGARVILGNHDLIATGRLGFERCANNARYALERTRRTLGRETAQWLATLPERLLVDESIALVHGGVRDVQLYMRTPLLVSRNATLLGADFPTARICFFGHSHFQKVYEIGETGEARELPLGGPLARDRVYFVNAGSLDAQRKSAYKLAECAIFDSDAWHIEFLSVPYDARATEAKAAAGGFRIPALTNWIYNWRRRLLAA